MALTVLCLALTVLYLALTVFYLALAVLCLALSVLDQALNPALAVLYVSYSLGMLQQLAGTYDKVPLDEMFHFDLDDRSAS